MEFTFLHAADIHLDSPLRGLAMRGEGRAAPFISASRRAFVNLVEHAVDRDVDFLVIAGDLFDGDWRDYGTGLFFAEQMGVLGRKGIRAFVVYGNHDAESVVRQKLPWPDNVKIFSAKHPESIEIPELRSAIHGRSFPRRDVAENIAAEYPAPKAGYFNIGILHTACEGREGHAPYAPCTLDQLRIHGYHYWALGHVHAREVLCEAPHVVFPGNLQGRHIRETGSKGATQVTVRDGNVAAIEHVALDSARWASIELDLTGADDAADCLAAARESLAKESRTAEGRPLAVRIALRGKTKLHLHLAGKPSQLRADLEAAALAVSDQIWIEKVRVATEEVPGPALALREDTLGALVKLTAEAAADPGVRARIAAELKELRSRIPKDDEEALAAVSDRNLDALMTEARQVALARLEREEAS